MPEIGAVSAFRAGLEPPLDVVFALPPILAPDRFPRPPRCCDSTCVGLRASVPRERERSSSLEPPQRPRATGSELA